MNQEKKHTTWEKILTSNLETLDSEQTEQNRPQKRNSRELQQMQEQKNTNKHQQIKGRESAPQKCTQWIARRKMSAKTSSRFPGFFIFPFFGFV